MKRCSRAFSCLVALGLISQYVNLQANDETLVQTPLLEWQSAYIIEDVPRHFEIAKNLFQKEPNAFHASLLMRSYSQNLQVEEAVGVFEGAFKSQIIKDYPEAMKDLAWSCLAFHMNSAPSEQVFWILQSLHLVREIEMAPLVIEALSHPDLRINMTALSLVESYPLDVYRPLVLELWKDRSNTLLKARILSLAAHLKWPETEEMVSKLKEAGESLPRELVIALADYEMLKSSLDLNALFSMTQAQSLIPVRMAAWCLRYQSDDLEDLSGVYRAIFEKKDSLSTLLALDSLLHFHSKRVKDLEEVLKSTQSNWPSSLIDRQISWVFALVNGSQERMDWVKKQALKDAKDSSQGQAAIAWALASRFQDSNLVTCLWRERHQLPPCTQLQIAWSIVQTSHKHEAVTGAQALNYISRWLLDGPNYWLQDSDWPGLKQICENPPLWMPAFFVRESAVELKLAILKDLSLRFPEQAYQIATKLYTKEPEAYLSSLMMLAWSQGKTLPAGNKGEEKETLLLRALMRADSKDKAQLAAHFTTSDELWKERIMNAMLQLADESDLEFFATSLKLPARLSIKSASGILIALRQGTRSNPSQ